MTTLSTLCTPLPRGECRSANRIQAASPLGAPPPRGLPRSLMYNLIYDKVLWRHGCFEGVGPKYSFHDYGSFFHEIALTLPIPTSIFHKGRVAFHGLLA